MAEQTDTKGSVVNNDNADEIRKIARDLIEAHLRLEKLCEKEQPGRVRDTLRVAGLRVIEAASDIHRVCQPINQISWPQQ